MISIHALRVESALILFPIGCRRWDFYPRSPCGERRDIRRNDKGQFLISIHALRVESDQVVVGCAPVHLLISIHALRVESDKVRRKIHRSNTG